MKSKLFLLLGVVTLLFVACKKEDPFEKVYLQKFVINLNAGGIQNTTTNEYVWEDGLLIKQRATTTLLGMTVVATHCYEYEGTNVVRTYMLNDDGDTSLLTNYMYENGRLKSFESSSTSGVITGYTSNGEIAGFELTTFGVSYKYELEWKDGDMVKSKEIKILPDGTEEVNYYEFEYDDKPSMYSHFPIVEGIDGDYAVALKTSKHNLKIKDYTYEYKDNRLVKKVNTDGTLDESMSMYYTDGVGPDTK